MRGIAVKVLHALPPEEATTTCRASAAHLRNAPSAQQHATAPRTETPAPRPAHKESLRRRRDEVRESAGKRKNTLRWHTQSQQGSTQLDTARRHRRPKPKQDPKCKSGAGGAPTNPAPSDALIRHPRIEPMTPRCLGHIESRDTHPTELKSSTMKVGQHRTLYH